MSHLIDLRKIAISLAMFAIVALGAATVARADATFVGSSGELAASVNFHLDGNILTVTLTNTSTFDVNDPPDILTAVFFSANNVVGLTPGTAVLNAGSTVFFDADGQPAGGVVGGEWAYASGLVGAPGGATQGISSAGFGLFGLANFTGANLDGEDGVDGLQYGITSAGDDLSTGNAPVTGGNPLIKNSVVFTLTVPAGFDVNSITNVSFQYGTALNEPNIPGVPEPATMLLLGTGLVGLAAGLRRRMHR